MAQKCLKSHWDTYQDVLVNAEDHLAKQEAEKKVLAKELLKRYQAIDLFDDISTQLTTSLDTRQIAQLVLQGIIHAAQHYVAVRQTHVLVIKRGERTAHRTMMLRHTVDVLPGHVVLGDIARAGMTRP